MMRGHAREAELNDFIDGGLPVRRRTGLAEHLRECQSCAERYAAARDTVARIRALPRRAPFLRAAALAPSSMTGGRSLRQGHGLNQ